MRPTTPTVSRALPRPPRGPDGRAGRRTRPRAPGYGAVAVWVALVLALGAGGCGDRPPPAPDVDDALAVVEDDEILTEDFERTYVAHLLQTGEPDSEAGRWAHLERLIAEALLARAAQARGLDGVGSVREALSVRRDQALASAYYDRAFVESLPPPTEAEVRSAYARDAARAVVRHALFTTEAEAAAARAEVAAGRPFAEVAARSFGVASDSAGVLGAVGYFELDDAVAEAAFGQNPGAISGPVRSSYGWHLVQTLDLLTTPVLTADGLEARRAGLTNRVAQRKRRLEGGTFVRSVMEPLGVAVRPDAVRRLATAVAGLDGVPAPTEGPGEMRVDDWRSVSEALAPGTELLAYTDGGEARTFTAGQFLRWLPTLPYAELVQRPAASVGRALRNEVFARRAEAEGLADDPFVVREVARARREILASVMRRALEDVAPDRAPSVLVSDAARRLERRLPRTVRVDGWAVQTATRAQAERALALVEAGADPATLAGYRPLAAADPVELPELRDALRRAPLGQPAAAGLPDGTWAVLRVDRRDETATRLTAAQRDSVARRLAPRVPEYDLVRALRERAEVRVDTAAFRAIMVGPRRAGA